jgi:hypothetical protein
MVKTRKDSDGGKRWPQSSKGKPVPRSYIVRTDKNEAIVADTVRLLDDGTLVLERNKRPNLFAPGTWKALLIEQGA